MQFSQLNRRKFISVIGGTAAWPLAVEAQQDARIARVGALGPAIDTVPAVQTAYPFFLAELRKLGFETGRNVLVEYRASGQGLPQATAAVNELVAWKVDVIFVLAVEFALKAAVAHFEICRGKLKSCEFGSKYFAVTFYFLTNQFIKVVGFQQLIVHFHK
jgi:hypothetical protein